MKIKQFLATLLIMAVIIPPFSINVPFVNARDWALQISDPKDSKNDLDIKTIYARDDNTYLYFKVESFGTWNFEENDGSLGLFISMDGVKEPTDENMWVLVVGETEGQYEGMAMDMDSNDIEPIEIEFTKDSKIGTLKVEKSLIQMKSSKISMASMIISLNNNGGIIDSAPDNFSFVLYKPGEGGPAKLSVSTHSLVWGEIKYKEIKSGTFEIYNEGEGTLNAILKPSQNIKLSTKEIKLDDYGTESITVYVDANQLNPKTYSEKIEIESKYGNETILVEFEILPHPILNVDTELIDFGTVIKGSMKTDKFTISNQVKGIISGTITTDNQWIFLSKKSFESLSEDISVTLSTASLEPGPMEGFIQVLSDGGNATVAIKAHIINSLLITPEILDFGDINLDEPDLTPHNVSLKNQTNQKLIVTISTSDPWIKIRSEMEIEAFGIEEVAVRIDLDKMGEINKNYGGEIKFETKFGELTIPVKAYLKQEPPRLVWDNSLPGQTRIEEKIVSGKIWEKIILIKNDGSGILVISSQWENQLTDFQLINASFSLKKEEAREIRIKLDTKDLKTGLYQNNLMISSNGGDLSIPILLTIVPKPEIIVRLFIGLPFAYINEQKITLDTAPFINNGYTMVPLRFIADTFKAKIDWLPIGKGRIILTFPQKTIQMDIGEWFAFINGTKIQLQTPALIKNSRTFVPLRFIAEGLGAKVTWNAQNQQITINYIFEE